MVDGHCEDREFANTLLYVSGGFQLQAKRSQPWRADAALPQGVGVDQVHYGPDPAGPGGLGFQVATARLAPGKPAPTLGDLRALHKLRTGTGTTPTVIAVSNGTNAWLFGPSTEEVRDPLPHELAQRYLQSVLTEPNIQAAYNRMVSLSHASATTAIPGVANSGLFASYHLRENAKQRSDWAAATTAAGPLLAKRGQQLIQALGFRSEAGTGGAQILSGASGPPTAVAILLDESEHFEATSQRFQLSPVAFGLRIAMNKGIPWLIVLRRDQIRLYPGKDGVGVGQKGQTETFIELDLASLDADYAALLPLIFSAGALAPEGTTQQLLDDSSRFASSLGARLRERIYDKVVPKLAKAVAEALAANGLSLDAAGLSVAYRVTLRILFRLLFQAYAEDRGLLPSGRNERYDANSLKTAAKRDMDTNPDDFSADGHQLWLDLVQVWDAIERGNKLWQVPAYNGGLFSSDPATSAEGALLATIALPDSVIGPALQHLLVDISEDGIPGPVDFRSLSVREFGTIYEGLLESSLSVADQDLTVDTSEAWVPAKAGDAIEAAAGSVYFHSASGERKATGSYFTPKIVVDHLIDGSITPALHAHLAKVADLLVNGKDVEAERIFFDFRVVDLAMGSAHFLVAAVDKVEALMRNFLTEHSLPGVQSELLRLAEVAKEALGDDEIGKAEVDNVALLRRQVARRCVYGVDINELAVELARLAVWIHTFVPGLPMSNLEHGLVNANSLTGVGTIDEALNALQPGRSGTQATLFDEVIANSLVSAKTLLVDMANAGEADKQQVAEAAQLLADARMAAEPTRRIFDAAVSTRTGQVRPGSIMGPSDIDALMSRGILAEVGKRLNPAHMPYLFPEVFERENPGFDVVIGNPPWDKVRWEAAPFWAKVSPGLMALPAAARDAKIEELRAHRTLEAARETTEIAERQQLQEYFKKAFNLRGGTHLELAQLMLERALSVTNTSGRIALVLPRQSLVLSGWKNLRRKIADDGDVTIVQARNHGGWLFEGVDNRYAIALLTTGPSTGAAVRIGVATSARSLANLSDSDYIQIDNAELATYSDAMVIPWFASPDQKTVFDKIRAGAKLGSGMGWVTGSSSSKWDFSGSGRHKSFASTTKSSASAWGVLMTRHVDPYRIADDAIQRWINDPEGLARENADRGVAVGPSGALLTVDHPIITYRFPSRSDDTRTVIAAALPEKGYLYSTGYAHGISHPEGTSATLKLALLGYLNSRIADWWARRFVDRHVTAPVINNLPLPNLDLVAIEALAARVAVLLQGAGYTTLPGGIDTHAVAQQSPYAHRDEEHLLAGIEVIVARGYGLTADDLSVIRRDFNAAGFPDGVFDTAHRLLASGAEV